MGRERAKSGGNVRNYSSGVAHFGPDRFIFSNWDDAILDLKLMPDQNGIS
jgi:hypothetical protein